MTDPIASPVRRPGAAPAALWSELAIATVATALAVLAGMLAERAFAFGEQSLIFITAVLFVAVRARMAVAAYAAVLCFLAYNFFFIHPRYTLYIAAGQGVATVAMFLLAALVCGRLANRLRTQVLMLQAANARTEALQELSQHLAAAADEDDVARVAVRALHQALDADAVWLALDENTDRLGEALSAPAGVVPDVALRMAVKASLSGLSADAPMTATRLDTAWWCFPLALGERALGALCLRYADPDPVLPREQASLAQAMVQIVAQALARTRLVEQLETVRVQAETERLRAALLSSVSHDLRSPLSTIIGSAESLSAYRDKLTPEDQTILAQDILGEGRRLDRYIQNLLDMTRLEHGGLALAREWVGLDEICGALLPRLRQLHPAVAVQLHLPEPPPLLQAHPALLEQALFNVLDNAGKFSPPGQPITLAAARDHDDWRIDIDDRGPGIPEADRARVFDMFFSVERGDRGTPGTGLGLSICQGIIAAHGGRIEALAGADGVGTTVRIHLPATDPPADRPRED